MSRAGMGRGSDGPTVSCLLLVFLMSLYRVLKGCSYGGRGFLEDRMMENHQQGHLFFLPEHAVR